MSSEFSPTAPPTYQESEGYNGALPSSQEQFVRKLSYGTGSVQGPVLQNQEPVVVATVQHYYTNYPPPQPVFVQPTVINNSTVVQPICREPMLGKKSCSVFCFVCQARVKTVVKSYYPLCVHFCCCLMFISVGLTLCSPMAYCCSEPNKVVHTCPNCKSVIGTYYLTD